MFYFRYIIWYIYIYVKTKSIFYYYYDDYCCIYVVEILLLLCWNERKREKDLHICIFIYIYVRIVERAVKKVHIWCVVCCWFRRGVMIYPLSGATLSISESLTSLTRRYKGNMCTKRSSPWWLWCCNTHIHIFIHTP